MADTYKPELDLLSGLSAIIQSGKEQAVAQMNSALLEVYWAVGNHINLFLLQGERAEYGKQIVVTASRQLVEVHGRAFEEKNLRRMMQFAELYTPEIVATLSRHLSWSHIVVLLPIRDIKARLFYELKIANERWSVRELRQAISRKVFERSALAELQLDPQSDRVGLATFKDPYFLEFLQLHDEHLESDLEEAILRNLEQFILELGRGFAFVERQKRMIIDGEDHHLDLLFYHRSLRRLVAIELKIGKFEAAHKGQMELYLNWLDRYERQNGEESPIGLILCAESSREKIELLNMKEDGIMVAEYWTQLPSKAQLEARLHQALVEARERLSIRELKSHD